MLDYSRFSKPNFLIASRHEDYLQQYTENRLKSQDSNLRALDKVVSNYSLLCKDLGHSYLLYAKSKLSGNFFRPSS